MSNTEEFDLKRSQIINCAEELFISEGYEVTTVDAILKQLGIAKGTFYYYFDSKEEVMDAVIAKHINEEIEYANTMLSNVEIPPIEKLITVLFRKSKSPEKREMVEQMFEANNALMKQKSMLHTLEMVCPVYAQIIIEGNRTKDFSSNNPLADIQFLIAGFQTLYDLSSAKESTITVDIESIVENMFRVLKIDTSKTSKNIVKKLISERI